MSPREKLLTELDHLNDDQISQVLTYVETLYTDEPIKAYDPDDDPAIGFFAASPDLASQTKDILRVEFGQREQEDEVV